MFERARIKKLFWTVNLPLIVLSLLWCWIQKVNVLDSWVFQLAVVSTVPMLLIKTEETQEQCIAKEIEKFKAMDATEFLNYREEFKKSL